MASFGSSQQEKEIPINFFWFGWARSSSAFIFSCSSPFRFPSKKKKASVSNHTAIRLWNVKFLSPCCCLFSNPGQARVSKLKNKQNEKFLKASRLVCLARWSWCHRRITFCPWFPFVFVWFLDDCYTAGVQSCLVCFRRWWLWLNSFGR